MHYIPYIANIVILLPVVSGLMRGRMDAFPQAVDSPVLRLMVASLWCGVLITSAVALFAPLVFWPLLAFQVIYKAIFILLWVWPGTLRPERAAIPWGPTLIFLVIIVVWPFFIAAAL